jgi:hypothetical protein
MFSFKKYFYLKYFTYKYFFFNGCDDGMSIVVTYTTSNDRSNSWNEGFLGFNHKIII